MQTHSGQRGAVLMMSIVVLLAVMAMGMALLAAGRYNRSMAVNAREKMKSFYAADGMMTKLAQEIIKGNGDQYIRPPSFTGHDVASASPAGKDTTNKDTLVVRGGGVNGLTAAIDQFHFEFIRDTGDFDFAVAVASIDTPNVNALMGLMARDDTSRNARFVCFYLQPNGTAKLAYRDTVGKAVKSAGTWALGRRPIRLMRQGNKFTAYRDQGLGWNDIASKTVTLNSIVLMGIAVSSGASSKLCTAKLTRWTGVSGIDTAQVGDYRVQYTIGKSASGTFEVSTRAFKAIAINSATYATRLSQTIVTAGRGGFVTQVEDSMWLPITLYDFRSDGSSTDFEWDAAMGTLCKGMVKDSLDNMRRPIKSTPTAYRNCLIDSNFTSNPALNRCYQVRTASTANPGFPARNGHGKGWRPVNTRLANWWPDFKDCVNLGSATAGKFPRGGCEQQFPDPNSRNWYFSDSLNVWFRPWAAPSAVYDTSTGTWSTLVYNTTMKAWQGPNFATKRSAKDTGAMNVVVYDSLCFVRDTTEVLSPGNKNTYVYGKWVDTAHFSFSDASLSVPWGGTEPWTRMFHPLKGKGFGYDGECDSIISGKCYKCVNGDCAPTANRYMYGTAWGKFQNQNNAFTMEIHRKFVYDTSQVFVFFGNDDVWLFIANKLVLDLGGIHGMNPDTLRLKNLVSSGKVSMTPGKEYWFDFFFAERNSWGSEIRISTNIMMYQPPQPNERRWKRDYGFLD